MEGRAEQIQLWRLPVPDDRGMGTAPARRAIVKAKRRAKAIILFVGLKDP